MGGRAWDVGSVRSPLDRQGQARGAVELARQAAAKANDQAMVARAEDILRRLRAQRRRPNDGWLDRFGEWDAVR